MSVDKGTLIDTTKPLIATKGRRQLSNEDRRRLFMSKSSVDDSKFGEVYCAILFGDGISEEQLRAQFPKSKITKHIEALEQSCAIFENDGLYYPIPARLTGKDRAYGLLRDMPNKCLFIDTETTGLNEDRDDEILQLSIIDGTGKILFD